MPLLPASTLLHAPSTVLPTGEMMPRPVKTTRRFDKRLPQMGEWITAGNREDENRAAILGRSVADLNPLTHGATALGPHMRSRLGAALSDVVDRLLNGGDLLSVFVRDFGFELFLERHNQLDGVER